MTSLVPLNSIAHRRLKMNAHVSYSHTKEKHMMPIFASEFMMACAEYPIVFVKPEGSDQMQSVVLTGIKPKQNLFFSESDGWIGKYTPVNSTNFPILVLHNSESEGEVLVCVEEKSSRISEESGEPLFEKDGEQTAFLKSQISDAIELRKHAQQTQRFIERLNELELIDSKVVSVKPKEEEAFNILGLFVISEQRLSELDENQFLELRSLGYLPAIYASLSSYYRLDHLVKRYDAKQCRLAP